MKLVRSGKTTPNLIPVPNPFTASSVCHERFVLNWTIPSGAVIDCCEIQVANDTGFTDLVAGDWNNVCIPYTRYTITGLMVNHTYYCRVRASRRGIYSAWSQYITVITIPYMLRVRSNPTGAAIFKDGAPTGVNTSYRFSPTIWGDLTGLYSVGLYSYDYGEAQSVVWPFNADVRIMFTATLPAIGRYTGLEIHTMVYEEGYIPIANIDELTQIVYNLNGGSATFGAGTPWESEYVYGFDKNYIMLADLDFDDLEEGREWTPIGTMSYPYTGKFDGNSFTIDNLHIDTTVDNVGLFGVLRSASIKHLNITNAFVRGRHQIGILAGSAYDDTDISEVYATGTVISTN